MRASELYKQLNLDNEENARVEVNFSVLKIFFR